VRPSLEEGLAAANTAFTYIFCVELGSKLVGLGPWGYFTDAWNCFDAAVVTVSLIELGLSQGGSMSALRSLRSLRVLKSFRVLRIIKMFRYMESLRQIAAVSTRLGARACAQQAQAPAVVGPARLRTANAGPPAHSCRRTPPQVLATSLNSFAAIVALLALFWLVFAIVGLHVFGGLALAPPAWPNCDTLVNCLILNFHVREPGREMVQQPGRAVCL
jgi:hypothetical protein